MSVPRLRIATRASRLALWQARHIATLLGRCGPQLEVELVEVSTTADLDQLQSLDAMVGAGGAPRTGVFTREVQQAVLDGRADLAVHSLKDLPTEPVAGLVLASVPERGDSGDALVVPRGAVAELDQLPERARVGTGSLRRQAQLKHRRADLQVSGIRGNVETRIRKLDEGDFDAVVLAVAGLKRLGLDDRIGSVLDPRLVLPAVGQGAIGLECRDDDAATAGWLEKIEDPPTRQAVDAERAMLARLKAGCHAPVGVIALQREGGLELRGVVLDPAGSRRVEAEGVGDPAEPVSLGWEVADRLLADGAAELIG